MGGMSGGGGGGGGNLASSIVSSVANIGAGHFADRQLKKGSRYSQEMQDKANALYTEQYGQTQQEFAPFLKNVPGAIEALARTYGIAEGQNGQADFSGFENSPDYLWAQQQGEQGANRQAAARGRLYSGAQAKAISRFNQGNATQYLGNYRQGLGNFAGMGLGATNSLANYRQGYTNQLGQGYTNKGDIEYARRLGRANINYKNVAAQDEIWGGYSGPQNKQEGGGPSNFLSPQQGSNVTDSNYSIGNNWNMNWGG